MPRYQQPNEADAMPPWVIPAIICLGLALALGVLYVPPPM